MISSFRCGTAAIAKGIWNWNLLPDITSLVHNGDCCHLFGNKRREAIGNVVKFWNRAVGKGKSTNSYFKGFVVVIPFAWLAVCWIRPY